MQRSGVQNHRAEGIQLADLLLVTPTKPILREGSSGPATGTRGSWPRSGAIATAWAV